MNKRCLVTMSVITMALAIRADTDKRTVASEFERCHANMERFERSLRRYDDAIDRLREAAAKLRTDKRKDHSRELTTLENRREYFHNRYERSRSQSEKLRGDLKNVNGPTCPSCIQSSVNMYCRMIEMVQNELDEYTSKASDLYRRSSGRSGPTTPAPEAKSDSRDFRMRRSEIDSLYRPASSCGSTAAQTLLDQVKIMLERADSLDRCNDSAAARKSLDISDALLRKASERCNEGK